MSPDDRQRRERISRHIWEATGGRVFAGPFAGLKVPLRSVFLNQPNLLVGSYESELHEALLRAVVSGADSVVNIGAAEGYYAAGLALLLPEARVTAYEQDESMIELCREVADLNGLTPRMTFKGRCDPADLREPPGRTPLVFIDCEGGEVDLLDPAIAPWLRDATIFCEVHDFYRKDAGATLLSRFRATHEIEILIERQNDPAAFRILNGLTPADRLLAIHENRHVRGETFSAKYMVFRPRHG